MSERANRRSRRGAAHEQPAAAEAAQPRASRRSRRAGASHEQPAATADAQLGAPATDEHGLLSLSADALGHVLKSLPDAEDIARAAPACRAFKLAATHAADARAAACFLPLPPLSAGEPKLRALRWAEAVIRRPPRTLAGGFAHSLIISKALAGGFAYSWLCACGDGERGRLGLALQDGETQVLAPRRVDVAAQPREVSASGGMSLLLDANGAVWSWGLSYQGRDQSSPSDRPGRLGSIASTRILQVSAGRHHALLLTSSGGVLAFGNNSGHELGTGNRADCYLPTAVARFSSSAGCRAIEVSAGDYHSCAVDETGALWTWGSGTNGKLGHGDGGEGSSWQGSNWPISARVPKRVDALAEVRMRHVCAGSRHTLAVSSDGRLFTWGGGSKGKLGHGSVDEMLFPEEVVLIPSQRVRRKFYNTRVRQVAAGTDHSVVLTEGGDVYTMGWGEEGQLGNGEYSQTPLSGFIWQSVPVPVRSLSVPFTEEAVNAMSQDEIVHAMQERMGRVTFPRVATNVLARQLLAGQPDNAPSVEVAAGDHHTLVRTADGKVFSFGRGFDGQLGHGDTKQVSIPKQIDAGALRAEPMNSE